VLYFALAVIQCFMRVILQVTRRSKFYSPRHRVFLLVFAAGFSSQAANVHVVFLANLSENNDQNYPNLLCVLRPCFFINAAHDLWIVCRCAGYHDDLPV
jgi:hypothetical protein